MLPSLLWPADKSVNSHIRKTRILPAAWLACLFFFSAGRAFIPHLGVQNDEALFGTAIYEPRGEIYMVQIGHSKLPLMLMSYLGTLKAWIYRPLFRAFGTGISVLRDPVLVAGVLGLWLFYLLMRRMAGERAAVIGCSLLAVDSLYLLTICFDWGPVALQHLLTVGGLLLLVRFYQTRSHWALAGAGFLFGLGMWDKALAVWMLAGIGIAGILTFPRQIFAVITFRRVAIGVLAFALGALPLIVYNVDQDFATFRGNVAYDIHDVPGKARLLLNTVQGQGLFGFMVAEDSQTPIPHQPRNLLQRLSADISTFAGHPRHTLLLYAFLLALALAPLARGNALRTILFALIAMAVAWAQMAITPGAGGSVHHTILLWPFPIVVIAVSFAAASRRLGRRAGLAALSVVMAAVMISSVLVTNEYFALMIRNGGAQNFTDGIFNLSAYIKGVPATNVFCVDWGILDSLRVLNRGKLPLRVGTSEISRPQLSEEDQKIVRDMISDSGAVFLAHTRELEFFEGVNGKLVGFAADAGYERRMMAVIPDSYGRPTYEVYRFAAAGTPSP